MISIILDIVNIANAQNTSSILKKNPSLQNILAGVSEKILSPIILVMFTLSFFMFAYGILGMIINPDDSDKRKNAVNSILWGVVGMAIMLSVYGIFNLIVNTLAPVGVVNPLN